MKWMDATFRPSKMPEVQAEPDGSVEVSFHDPEDSTTLTILLTSGQASRLARRIAHLISEGAVNEADNARDSG
jgi:hypothetical protein